MGQSFFVKESLKGLEIRLFYDIVVYRCTYSNKKCYIAGIITLSGNCFLLIGVDC